MAIGHIILQSLINMDLRP